MQNNDNNRELFILSHLKLYNGFMTGPVQNVSPHEVKNWINLICDHIIKNLLCEPEPTDLLIKSDSKECLAHKAVLLSLVKPLRR